MRFETYAVGNWATYHFGGPGGSAEVRRRTHALVFLAHEIDPSRFEVSGRVNARTFLGVPPVFLAGGPVEVVRVGEPPPPGHPDPAAWVCGHRAHWWRLTFALTEQAGPWNEMIVPDGSGGLKRVTADGFEALDFTAVFGAADFPPPPG